MADMSDFSCPDTVLDRYELELDAQFSQTNEHILENINGYIETDGIGGYKRTSERNTQAEALVDAALDIMLFPDGEYVRITEAINTVNRTSNILLDDDV